MRVLTFNHHESYLCSLAAVGHDFDVVVRRGDLDLSWNVRARPVPANFRLVEFDDAVRQSLRRGDYDVVVCHTVKNLIWMWPYKRCRYVFIAHIPLFTNTMANRLKGLVKKAVWRTFKATHRARFFAVSHFKRDAWNEPGDVAVLTPEAFPALKPLDGPSEIAIVCNDLASRGEELGLGMIERLAREFPVRVIGRNPGIPFNIQPRDFADFQDTVTRFHIYLYTIKMPWGDGYNTAMLEAMRMGMAIVTVENPSSPIVHGVNGLIGRNESELRQHIASLRANPDLAARLGAEAQKTIESRFNRQQYLDTWTRVLAD